MNHQTHGQWDDRPSYPSYDIEDCRIFGNSAPALQVTLKLWQEDPWVQKEELRDFCASLMSFTQDLEQNVHTCKDNSHKYNATQIILIKVKKILKGSLDSIPSPSP